QRFAEEVAAGKRQDIVIPEDAKILDAGGLYTAPGLVDIHNHGSKDALFVDDPIACSEHFLRHGETTILPTLYCNLSLEQILSGVRNIRLATIDGAGRIIAGLYMEGPYMNGEGSDQKHILWGGDPDFEEYMPLIENVKDLAKVWSVCPARPGIEGFLQDLKLICPEAIIALGHSHATAADCRKIKKYGLKLQTHHGDSGKAPGPNQVTIGAGCDEFTLYDPDMYAELICDQEGIHLPGDLIKMVIRAKGIERIILITDSMPASGDYKNNEADGVAYGPDLNYDYEGHLAGSHLTLDSACRNLMSHTGYGLCHAIRCASLNPARLLGMDGEIGSIEAGKRANLILIDDAVNVHKVILQGELVCQNDI
ncbi:MAG: amidohydrolase family protein, partial [Oscillospiraceae bacterium]|nr:amidohydrolase family protein [Oscillospiraceae bacterium]